MTASVDMIGPSEVDGVEITYLDAVPEEGNPAGRAFYCEECGTGISTPSGRKPRVMLCDEHRKNAPKGTRSPGGSAVGATAALIERAISELQSGYSLIGSATKFIDPITGECIVDQKEALAESWRALLTTNKKLRDLFAKTEQGMAYLPLIVAHGDLIVKIMLLKRIDSQQLLMSEANAGTDGAL